MTTNEANYCIYFHSSLYSKSPTYKWVPFQDHIRKCNKVSLGTQIIQWAIHHCFYTCFQTCWAWNKDLYSVQHSTVMYTKAQAPVEDACMWLYTRHMWTHVTGRGQAHSHLSQQLEGSYVGNFLYEQRNNQSFHCFYLLFELQEHFPGGRSQFGTSTGAPSGTVTQASSQHCKLQIPKNYPLPSVTLLTHTQTRGTHKPTAHFRQASDSKKLRRKTKIGSWDHDFRTQVEMNYKRAETGITRNKNLKEFYILFSLQNLSLGISFLYLWVLGRNLT